MGRGGGRGGQKGRVSPKFPTSTDWPMEGSKPLNDFIRSEDREPHIIRHKEIIKKYPEIEKLQGYDWRPAPFAVLIVASQLALAYYQQKWSMGIRFLVAWLYGGAASHALSLMTHELSHNLLFPSPRANELFGIFCNIGMGLPSSTMFKRYHMEHHMYQGDSEKDVDVPTKWEGTFFTSTFLKCIWLLLQPLFYAFRPSVVRPKSYRPIDLFNVAVIVASNLFLIKNWGLSSVVYLIVSSLLGMGFHPVAGHFIAEHYVFPGDGVETYSYYGPLNWICWNVGYHNEHHDFPKVPGWRLPEVKRIASEYYDDLPQHPSWTWVLVRWLTSDNVGPFNRVVRGGKIE